MKTKYLTPLGAATWVLHFKEEEAKQWEEIFFH